MTTHPQQRPHTEQTTERGKPTTTHPQQWVCGHVRSWPGGSKEKPANNEDRTVRVQMTTRQPNMQQTKRRQTMPRQVRTRPPSDHANHTPAAADHRLNHKKPPPNEPPLPKTTTCVPPLNRNPPKLRQKTMRATGTTHLPKGCVGFQGCPSVPTTRRNRELKTPDPPDKTWEQGCTMQDARNTRQNHTPALAEAETQHAKNTPERNPVTGTHGTRLRGPRTNHAPASAGVWQYWVPSPSLREKPPHEIWRGPSPQTPTTDATPGKAPTPLQKITPETGWATV
ncbi:hypothetical protein BS47DRAFT_1357317 [Hydnum rufescens UP504]|uniref:Uncharacterized protein n=1 Tax=Hydnum rufescens UP504 TaxID=1448309 RepID=A0A9P6BAD7_9AGAM|nr:hypothetical protein BS47DRAFT_1357317 [Hydnum rufescens UP504]